MTDLLKELAKQPYWVLALVFGAVLVAFPCITIDKDFHWLTHHPSTFWPVGIGLALLLVSLVGFWYAQVSNRFKDSDAVGLDLSRVKESNGALWTTVSGCEIRVIEGRIEEQSYKEDIAVALPCNEYFDDRCAGDKKSSLGAFVNRAFEGQVAEFIALMQSECRKSLGESVEQQKTYDERGDSYGVGRCIMISKPLGRSVPVALVSTTTQRAGHGLVARTSYLFEGMRELMTRLADARLSEVVMPILGAGHGGIDPRLAFVGLLLALAEAVRYKKESQRLKQVTIVVFKSDSSSVAEVDKTVVRRVLALISSQN